MYTGLCRVIVNKACIEGNMAGTQTSPRARRSRFNCWERLLRGDAGLSGQGPMNFRMTDRIQVPPYSERDGMESTQLEDDLDDSFISRPHHPPPHRIHWQNAEEQGLPREVGVRQDSINCRREGKSEPMTTETVSYQLLFIYLSPILLRKVLYLVLLPL